MKSGEKKTFRKLGLRSEILVSLALLLGAALLLGGFMFLRFAENGLLQARLNSARSSTYLAANYLSGVEFGESLSQLQAINFIEVQQRALDVTSWWFFNRDLMSLVSRSQQRANPFSIAKLSLLASGHEEYYEWHWPGLLSIMFGARDGYLDIAVPVRNGKQLMGVLQFRYSLADIIQELLQAQRLVFLYTILYGAVLTGFGMFLLQRNVIRPVRTLLAATRKVADGDLGARLSEEGPMEIKQLADSFNIMTEALRESRRESENHIRSLEESNEALKQTQDELVRSARLASVGNLAAGMAHEIGNPLGAITGYLELLRSELPPGRSLEIAKHTADEAARIDQLVRDLLDYATPDKGETELIDPLRVVQESIELLTNQGAFKNIQVQCEEDRAVGLSRMSSHKLLQVLVNLLINARDACGDSGLIAVTVKRCGEEIQLSIMDSGTGMKPEVVEHIFDPFFSTKETGHGRGLGLSVCQRVMTEAGGSIHVDSTPGQGSCFRVNLPVQSEVGDE